jgi:hypothetical protein
MLRRLLTLSSRKMQPAGMGVARRHQRIFAALAALALLVNLAASALCHAAPARAAAPALVDDVLGVLTICTTDGSGNIVHGGTQNPAEKQQGSCTVCTLLKVFAFAVALAFAAVVFPIRIAPVPVRRRVRTLAEHLSLGAIRTRAPPAFA